jgi:dynein heavy chain 1
VRAWEKDIDVFKIGEKVLERQRYKFGDDWRSVSYVDGEWSAFVEILSRKDAQVTSQFPQLQMKVTDESRQLKKRVDEILADWSRNKPVGNNVDPNDAIDKLAGDAVLAPGPRAWFDRNHVAAR